MTKYKSNLIPVGYLSKEAIDVAKGDMVQDMGVIRKITYVGQHVFTLEGNINYRTAGLQFETLSVLTGRKLYFVLPMDAIVNIMQYADPDNYEFEYLPLEPSSGYFYANENTSFTEQVYNAVRLIEND